MPGQMSLERIKSSFQVEELMQRQIPKALHSSCLEREKKPLMPCSGDLALLRPLVDLACHFLWMNNNKCRTKMFAPTL